METNAPMSWSGRLTMAAAVLLALWLVLSTSGPGTGIDVRTLVDEGQARALEATHRALSFTMLSAFDLDSTRDLTAIPAAIRRLDGQRVMVDGFMLPLDFDGGSVGRFMLNASYDMCMYGAPSLAHQRIDVTMAGGRRTRFGHTPIRVFGTLSVAPEFDGRTMVSLYRMTAEAVSAGG